MRWKLEKNEEFDIRSHYNELQGPLSTVIPWKGVWRVKAPWRVYFFDWTTAWGKILTGDNLIGVTRVRGVGSWWIIFYFIDP